MLPFILFFPDDTQLPQFVPSNLDEAKTFKRAKACKQEVLLIFFLKAFSSLEDKENFTCYQLWKDFQIEIQVNWYIDPIYYCDNLMPLLHW